MKMDKLALLEKTYDDFCNCEGGEGWLKIDGKEYSTDAGYAIEGVNIFMEVFKQRLADLPSVTPQLSSGLDKNSKKLEKDFGELDCISRADAIRVASGYCHPSNVAKELANLPSVTPQPRKGHWVHGEYCSKCGCDIPAYIIDWKWQKDMNAKYCPNCGAKMVEPQKSEDKE